MAASTIVVLAVAGTVIGGRMASRNNDAASSDANVKHVSLIDVSTFKNDSSVVSADGVVQSVSQVDLKSQMSGPLSYVSVSLGDSVYAGQIIAELSNADIRAQLDQAKASLTLEGVSVDSSRRSAIDSIRDSYLKADEAVHTQFDPLFLNDTGTTEQLSAFITDRFLYDSIQATRQDLDSIFINWEKLVNGLSDTTSDIAIQSGFNLSKKNIETIRKLFDNVQLGLNNASLVVLPSDFATLNSWKATVSAARSTLSGVASSLTNAEKSYASAIVTNGSGGVSSIASAGVKALQAQLDKTIIRSPISGKVAALPLRTGELAVPGQLIATIVGPGGIQVQAYASGEDISRIIKNAKVTISGKYTGIVTSVAPSVNSTNRKVEVKVLVTDAKKSELVIGENVSVAIQAGMSNVSSTVDANKYRLPIQNVKIVPGDAYIFTIDSDSKLVKHSVTLGTVTGDYVEIIGGITSDMKIISPVYELEEGQQVAIDQ